MAWKQYSIALHSIAVLPLTCGVVGHVVLYGGIESGVDDHTALFAVEDEVAVHHTLAQLIATQMKVNRVPA